MIIKKHAVRQTGSGSFDRSSLAIAAIQYQATIRVGEHDIPRSDGKPPMTPELKENTLRASVRTPFLSRYATTPLATTGRFDSTKVTEVRRETTDDQ